jgi:hypothetical protein
MVIKRLTIINEQVRENAHFGGRQGQLVNDAAEDLGGRGGD